MEFNIEFKPRILVNMFKSNYSPIVIHIDADHMGGMDFDYFGENYHREIYWKFSDSCAFVIEEVTSPNQETISSVMYNGTIPREVIIDSIENVKSTLETAVEDSKGRLKESGLDNLPESESLSFTILALLEAYKEIDNRLVGTPPYDFLRTLASNESFHATILGGRHELSVFKQSYYDSVQNSIEVLSKHLENRLG